MLGRRERRQPELFVAGSLRELLPDDHVLVRVDRVLDLGWLRAEVEPVRRRMHWDSEDVGLTEALAHPVGEVRRLGADAASVAGGWCVA
jgi:hypothetical protein